MSNDNNEINVNSIWQSINYKNDFYIVLSTNKADDLIEYRHLKGGELFMSYRLKFLSWFMHVQ